MDSFSCRRAIDARTWNLGPGWRVGGLLIALLVGVGCGDDDAGNNSPLPDAGSHEDGGVTGCTSTAECAALPDRPFCAPSGDCVACVEGDASRACPGTLSCCGTECLDLAADPLNCGGCGTVCDLPSASASCLAGECRIATCEAGYEDCDQDSENGCEVATIDGGCACVPGDTESCYTGPSGTEGVGSCLAGLRTCNAEGTGWSACVGEVVPQTDSCLNSDDDDCDGVVNNGYPDGDGCQCTPDATQPCYTGPTGTEGVGRCAAGTATCNALGTGWSACVGEVVPVEEICGNGEDDDCDGVADVVPDIDGDGWTRCDGDCCETTTECASPALVNPGAYEFVGNGMDDDCNPATSDTADATPCGDTGSFSVTASDLAMAMDLCHFTTQSPPLAERRWGVISAQFRRPAGTAPSVSEQTNMQTFQSATLADYGTVIVPRRGGTMVGLSSGRMRDSGDPNVVPPSPGTNFTVTGQLPMSYVGAHGGTLPAAAGCSGTCPAGSDAKDGINLRLTIRVPTNAMAFSFDFRFFTADYGAYVCTSYNDHFLALLTGSASGLPVDHNISFDGFGNPFTVNNAFIDTCTAKLCYTCPSGAADLAGTGLEVADVGAATSWLTTMAPVVPGETISLDLMIFDVGDGLIDSVVILDNFVWHPSATSVETIPAD